MKKLPSFELSLINGSILKSSSIKNKTVLFFYPKAMTSGCIIEVQEFQNSLLKFKKMGFTVIGSSKDSIEKNLKFSEKYKLKYLLASDLTNSCEKLKIWIEKSMYGKKYFGIDRSTFMIDSKGKLFYQWNKVKVKDHVKEVLEFAKQCT
jgi:peroxiredoxin Q/BCP